MADQSSLAVWGSPGLIQLKKAPQDTHASSWEKLMHERESVAHVVVHELLRSSGITDKRGKSIDDSFQISVGKYRLNRLDIAHLGSPGYSQATSTSALCNNISEEAQRKALLAAMLLEEAPFIQEVDVAARIRKQRAEIRSKIGESRGGMSGAKVRGQPNHLFAAITSSRGIISGVLECMRNGRLKIVKGSYFVHAEDGSTHFGDF